MAAPAEVVKEEMSVPVIKRELPPVPAGLAEDAVTLCLFYQYVEPMWTKTQHKKARSFVIGLGAKLNITGRGRCAAEGLNCTLTGSPENMRKFCQGLRAWNRKIQPLARVHLEREVSCLALAECELGCDDVTLRSSHAPYMPNLSPIPCTRPASHAMPCGNRLIHRFDFSGAHSCSHSASRSFFAACRAQSKPARTRP